MAVGTRAIRGSLFWSASVEQFSERIFEDVRASFIVALARKMLRWLEYLGLVDDDRCPVISERALPWLTCDEVACGPLVFCDDILNVGTTLSHYLSYSKRHLQATVKARVYARRAATNQFHERSPLQFDDLRIFETFGEEEYLQFETALPREILTLGKPYDIDFPILELRLSEATAELTHEQWYDLLEKNFVTVHDLTVSEQHAAGISSFSIFASSDRLTDQPNNAVAVQPPQKVRLFVCRSERVVRAVPMVIPATSTTALRNGTTVLPSELQQLFAEFSPLAKRAEPFELEPQYNLLVFLSSLDYGRMVVNRLRRCFTSTKDNVTHIVQRDLQFIFGRTVGHRLHQRLTIFLADNDCISEPSGRSDSPRDLSALLPAKPDLTNQIIEELNEYRGENPTRIFRETFRILDRLVQSNNPDASTSEPPTYDRLRVGLPLCDLWFIVRTVANMPTLTFEQISIMLDYFVDCGAVVPIVEEVGDAYRRSYRRGEADPIEFAQFVHGLLQEHEATYPDQSLGKFAFAKILSAVAIYHGDRVPIDPVFEYFGVVPNIRLPSVIEEQTEDALRFLERRGYVKFKNAEVVDDDRQKTLF